MKILKNFIGLAAIALCLGFASCSSDDDAPSYSEVAVDNSQLKTAHPINQGENSLILYKICTFAP